MEARQVVYYVITAESAGSAASSSFLAAQPGEFLPSSSDHHLRQEPSTSKSSSSSNVSICDSGYDSCSGEENSSSSSSSSNSAGQRLDKAASAAGADPLKSQKLYVLPSSPDTNLTDDPRSTLTKFGAAERCRIVNYFPSNPNIAPYMRNMVAGWMRDVCYEEMADAEVFPLAVSYMDRFLCHQTIFKTQLQGLATGCLLLASKIKMPIPFMATKLAAYTDDSVPVGQIMSWELLVLSRLNWDVSTVTSMDFVEPFLQQFCTTTGSYQQQELLHQLRASTVEAIHSLQMDFHFALLSQPDQAAVAIHYAAVNLFKSESESCQALSPKFPSIQMSVVRYWTQILDLFQRNDERFPRTAEQMPIDFQQNVHVVLPGYRHPLQGGHIIVVQN